MATYLKLNNQVSGPFTDAEIQQKLTARAVTPDTPAWRMGMAEWTTLATLFPARPSPVAPPVAPPPLPGAKSSPHPMDPALADIQMAVDNFFGPEGPPAPDAHPPQPDVLDRLQTMANEFLRPLRGRLGRTARPELLTYFCHRVVTAGLQRLRLDRLNGAVLTPKGEQFAAQAAAYLGAIVVHNWQRRGLNVFGRVHFEPGDPHNEILLAGERHRDGQQEVLSLDFLGDLHRELLTPRKTFPTMRGRAYILHSLTLPSPEQLYTYAACLVDSELAQGNWPQATRVGGLEADFQRSKQLLVDDLHRDCGLPLEDEALRKLSLWIVFPPYGWDMNDGNDYNFMTVCDQISHQRIVPQDVGVDYLRALLQCQSVDIRNFAARCLMVYRVPPRDWPEACHYQQAMAAADYDVARAAMAKYQHQLAGVERTEAWTGQIERERQSWVAPAVTLPWQNTPLFADPDYLALGQLPPERSAEGLPRLESLLRRYPDDWSLRTIHASILMKGSDPQRGESTLRELVRAPFRECADAHLRLGTLLKHQGRRDEAMQVFEDAVKRWPWHHQAVDSCLWLVTEGMTKFPETRSAAA